MTFPHLSVSVFPFSLIFDIHFIEAVLKVVRPFEAIDRKAGAVETSPRKPSPPLSPVSNKIEPPMSLNVIIPGVRILVESRAADFVFDMAAVITSDRGAQSSTSKKTLSASRAVVPTCSLEEFHQRCSFLSHSVSILNLEFYEIQKPNESKKPILTFSNSSSNAIQITIGNRFAELPVANVQTKKGKEKESVEVNEINSNFGLSIAKVAVVVSPTQIASLISAAFSGSTAFAVSLPNADGPDPVLELVMEDFRVVQKEISAGLDRLTSTIVSVGSLHAVVEPPSAAVIDHASLSSIIFSTNASFIKYEFSIMGWYRDLISLLLGLMAR